MKTTDNKRNIMQVRDEVIRLQNEAAKDPNHPSNDGLRAHFEETKRKLEQLKKEQNNHE